MTERAIMELGRAVQSAYPDYARQCLAAAIAEQGVVQVGERMGRAPSTVSRWARGLRRIPRVAREFIIKHWG